MEESSDVLPHEFPLVRDDEWKRQLALIRVLFSSADTRPRNDDDVIQELLFSGALAGAEEHQEQDEE